MNFLKPDILFLYPTKCYSTTIKAVLQQVDSAIEIVDADYGKHITLGSAVRIIEAACGFVPLNLRVVVPLREPHQRALSVYFSHMKPAFDDTAMSSKGVGLLDYFSSRINSLGYSTVDYAHYVDLDRYECIAIDASPERFLPSMASVAKELGLALDLSGVQKLNVSPAADVTVPRWELEYVVRKYYPASLALYRRLVEGGGRSKPWRR